MKIPTTIHKLLTAAILIAGLYFAFKTATQADIGGTVAEFRFDRESRNYAQTQQLLLADSRVGGRTATTKP